MNSLRLPAYVRQAVRRYGYLSCMVLLCIVTFGIQQVSALSPDQINLYKANVTRFDVANCSSGDCCPGGGASSGSTTLVGKNNEEKTWNYFKAKDLSDEQTAGIMGNLMQESHFDPQIIEGGGRSKDPNDAGGGGWGLIQWTPGSKVIGMAKEAGVEGPIYLLATQLDLVWEHMHNHPVVTATFDLNHFKTLKDEVAAAEYFGSQIEGFGTAGDRWQDATDALHKYGGSGGGSATSSNSAGGCSADSSVSPDCTSAEGRAKILCEAKKYDIVSYVWGGGHPGGGAAYHKACKTINTGDACGLDCSGLVSVAVYDAFGGNGTLAWDTNSLRADTANWREVSFGEVKPGDVMEPDAGHVEIVDHISGSTIHTFGAHSTSYPQPKQVGPTTYSKSSSTQYFRYIGKGSS
jgi:cell wall-associated NlpC family hydrolase